MEMGKEWKHYKFLEHFQQEADHVLDNDHHLVDFREEKQVQMESFRYRQQIHLEKVLMQRSTCCSDGRFSFEFSF